MTIAIFLATVYQYLTSVLPAWAMKYLPFVSHDFTELEAQFPQGLVPLKGDAPDTVKEGFKEFLEAIVGRFVKNALVRKLLTNLISQQIGTLLDALYDKWLTLNVLTPSVPTGPAITTMSPRATLSLDEAEFKADAVAHFSA